MQIIFDIQYIYQREIYRGEVRNIYFKKKKKSKKIQKNPKISKSEPNKFFLKIDIFKSKLCQKIEQKI